MMALNLGLFSVVLLIIVLGTCYFVGEASEILKDNHESCEFWASVGECDANPRYMLTNCAVSALAINPL